MAKYVTRTSKFTECKVMVCDTKNASVTNEIISINGWYNSFEKGTDGYNACQCYNGFTNTQIMVAVIDTTRKTEKRKMTTEKWLLLSEPCDGSEPDDEE